MSYLDQKQFDEAIVAAKDLNIEDVLPVIQALKEGRNYHSYLMGGPLSKLLGHSVTPQTCDRYRYKRLTTEEQQDLEDILNDAAYNLDRVVADYKSRREEARADSIDFDALREQRISDFAEAAPVEVEEIVPPLIENSPAPATAPAAAPVRDIPEVTAPAKVAKPQPGTRQSLTSDSLHAAKQAWKVANDLHEAYTSKWINLKLALASATMAMGLTGGPALIEQLTQPDTEADTETDLRVISNGAASSIEIVSHDPANCSPRNPIAFDGVRYDFVITDADTCRRLVNEATPAVGQVINLNSRMSITGMEDGKIRFDVEGQEGHVIPADVWRGILEAWLYSGFQRENPQDPNSEIVLGDPMPLSSFVGLLFIESRHCTLTTPESGSARGCGQFTLGTWTQVMYESGDLFGYPEVQQRLRDINDRIDGPLDYARMVEDSEVRRLFRHWTDNNTQSLLMTVFHAMDNLQDIQSMIDAGEIRHPEASYIKLPFNIRIPNGNMDVTERMIYIPHFAGPTAQKVFYREFDENGNQSIRAAISDEAFNRNDYFLIRNGRTLTISEFYNRLETAYGFGNRRLNVRDFQAPEYNQSLTMEFNPPQGDIANDYDIISRPGTMSYTGIHGEESYILQGVNGFEFVEKQDSADESQLAVNFN